MNGEVFKSLLETLLSLTILVFVLAAIRKVIMFFAAKYNVGGVSSLLS